MHLFVKVTASFEKKKEKGHITGQINYVSQNRTANTILMLGDVCLPKCLLLIFEQFGCFVFDVHNTSFQTE